jgi:hypothetical protein
VYKQSQEKVIEKEEECTGYTMCKQSDEEDKGQPSPYFIGKLLHSLGRHGLRGADALALRAVAAQVAFEKANLETVFSHDSTKV